ncbi:MAG: tetratricopeptide repeat protein [Bacteroidota bacterium]
MKKSQLYLTVGAIILVVVLYQLPRSVVENDQLQEVTETNKHSLEIPINVRNRIIELRSLIKTEENINKKARFTHALARVYLDFGVIDSAILCAKDIATWNGNASEIEADIYFTAFERSTTSENGIIYAEKAREILKQLLDKDPDNLFLKNRFAMTLIASENPMVGIGMLREIVAQDETNRQAIMNLGLLSIQSGQFEKAKARFEKLILLDSLDSEAMLYLAVSMIELDQSSQARLLLEEILTSQDSIPAIRLMANDYLQAL